MSFGDEATSLAELAKVAPSEDASEKFLKIKGVLKAFDACPFCSSVESVNPTQKNKPHHPEYGRSLVGEKPPKNTLEVSPMDMLQQILKGFQRFWNYSPLFWSKGWVSKS
jgi:hypothetical protein